MSDCRSIFINVTDVINLKNNLIFLSKRLYSFFYFILLQVDMIYMSYTHIFTYNTKFLSTTSTYVVYPLMGLLNGEMKRIKLDILCEHTLLQFININQNILTRKQCTQCILDELSLSIVNLEIEVVTRWSRVDLTRRVLVTRLLTRRRWQV